MGVRTRLSLDGTWQFQIDPQQHNEVNAITTWRTIEVPMPWQAQFDDLRHSSGVGWYRRRFMIDNAPNEETHSAFLHFGAIDYQAEIWINGERAGEHEGGYLPFSVDVITLLKAGENEIVVRVADPTDDEVFWPLYTFSEIPHGKQSWYGPISGIWQSVWLEIRPAIHIHHLRLTPDPATGAIECNVGLSSEVPQNVRFQYTINGPEDSTLDFDINDNNLQLHEPPVPWSPTTPALYTVSLQLFQDNVLLDEQSATCGFRTIEAKAGRIYLNGEPIYLRGALDQAYYPETIYTPPSLEFWRIRYARPRQWG